jgi:hypothetical protein
VLVKDGMKERRNEGKKERINEKRMITKTIEEYYFYEKKID